MQYRITISRNKKKIVEIVDAPNAADAESQVVRKRDKVLDIERISNDYHDVGLGVPKSK